MALVSLYVPDSVPRDFLNRVSSSLVQLAPALVEPYALFDRTEGCACSTRNALAIRERTILVSRHQHAVVGFPLYAVPADGTSEETHVIVTWLLRHRLKTFECAIVQNIPLSKRYDKPHTLKRTLGNRSMFIKTPFGVCCECYTLRDDPVFMLRSRLHSPYGTGPTLESVCRLNKVL